VIWFPPERLPLANGVQMISGGIGALAATTPVEAALRVTDWRGIFLMVSVLTLLAAVILFWVVPEKQEPARGETLQQQIAGVGQVLASPFFWSIAPWAIMAQAAYVSLVGLWAGPWLRDMAGLARMDVAGTLMWVAVAMTCGYLAFGLLAERLSRCGVPPMQVAACGMGLFLVVQVLLVKPWLPAVLPLWLLFGFCGTACILPYAVLSQGFPRHLAGRVNTGLNVFVFVAAFAAQWAIGLIIGLWPETANGGYHPSGYRAGFGALVVLQVLAAGWYLYSRKQRVRIKD